mgnify:CR=1 FL=1
MKRLIILCVTAILGAGAAVASGTHAGGHEGEMAVGEPGKDRRSQKVLEDFDARQGKQDHAKLEHQIPVARHALF